MELPAPQSLSLGEPSHPRTPATVPLTRRRFLLVSGTVAGAGALTSVVAIAQAPPISAYYHEEEPYPCEFINHCNSYLFCDEDEGKLYAVEVYCDSYTGAICKEIPYYMGECQV